MVKVLTDRQSKAAQLVKDSLDAGLPLSSKLVADAHSKAYETDAKSGSTIGARNMRNTAFLEALELRSDEARQKLNGVLWSCLDGTHPLWPQDRTVFIAALKIAANAVYGERVQLVVEEGEFSGKSIDELKYYAKNDCRWPSAEELAYYSQHRQWPATIEGAATVQ